MSENRRRHGERPSRGRQPIRQVRPFWSKPSECTCKLPQSRQTLIDVAKETKSVLPFILKDLPDIIADDSEMLSFDTVPQLQSEDCPRNGKATIKVLNEDTFNAAIMLMDTTSASNAPSGSQTSLATAASRPAVLNLASDKLVGGGWTRGAMAQEEALCYRSSLSLSLKSSYYPWNAKQGLYTPDVVIIRSSLTEGHRLLAPATPAAKLPVVSVVSIAAIQNPKVSETHTTAGNKITIYANNGDRDLMKQKMRLALRIAASRGHDSLVLGALGCGAYNNPVGEVVTAWEQVLTEAEFSGGWWKEVWFAVLDSKDGPNFKAFKEGLDGLQI